MLLLFSCSFISDSRSGVLLLRIGKDLTYVQKKGKGSVVLSIIPRVFLGKEDSNYHLVTRTGGFLDG